MSRGLAGLRVLLVGSLPPPHGGISVHVEALRDRLLGEGARVTVLDLGGRGARGPGSVVVAGPAGLAAHLALNAVAGALVHVQISGHTPKSWMVAAAGAAARRPGSPPPLLTVHSGLLPNFLALGGAGRRLAALVAGAYGRVVVVNRSLAGDLEALGVARSRIRVAPAFSGPVEPGVPPQGFERARAARRPLLSCALSPSPIYGARVLFAALPSIARRLPEAGVAVFGPARPDALRALARRHGVEDRLHLFGELDRPRALAVVAGSDLFVRPTLADGDALSVREALALGRPVLASDVGHRPKEVVLFAAGDALELAHKVERALGPRAAPSGAREEGAEAVLSVYRELVGAAA